MNLRIFDNKTLASSAAAVQAAAAIRAAIRKHRGARVVAATGTSQLEFLDELTRAPDIDWQCVELFHLDEYIGLPTSHPASFRRYLLDRLIRKAGIANYHLLDGDADPEEVAHRTGEELKTAPADIAFVGIGENGHLAFNDPPADFETETPFLIVTLDDACRRQQVSEGWFADLSEVPRQAITMSIRQILKARQIVALVPEARKAEAVKACVEGKISPVAPASALQMHINTTIFLDKQSAARLSASMKMQAQM